MKVFCKSFSKMTCSSSWVLTRQWPGCRQTCICTPVNAVVMYFIVPRKDHSHIFVLMSHIAHIFVNQQMIFTTLVKYISSGFWSVRGTSWTSWCARQISFRLLVAMKSLVTCAIKIVNNLSKGEYCAGRNLWSKKPPSTSWGHSPVVHLWKVLSLRKAFASIIRFSNDQWRTSSGSDQTRSQKAPLCGISWFLSISRIWEFTLVSMMKEW